MDVPVRQFFFFFSTSSCNLWSSLHHRLDKGRLYTLLPPTLPSPSLSLTHSYSQQLGAVGHGTHHLTSSLADLLSLQRLNKRWTFSRPCWLFTASRRCPAMNLDPPNSLASSSKPFFPRPALDSFLFLALHLFPRVAGGLRVSWSLGIIVLRLC